MSHRGVAQLGSARRSGRRGRRFKSCHPDKKFHLQSSILSRISRPSLINQPLGLVAIEQIAADQSMSHVSDLSAPDSYPHSGYSAPFELDNILISDVW